MGFGPFRDDDIYTYIYIYTHVDILLWHFNQPFDRFKLVTYKRPMWILVWRLIKHLEIIWPMRIESRLSPGYEVSFGRSSTRVGWLGAENNCYLLHYHVVSYYYITYHIIL